jgi:hypothetical protein
MASLGPSGGRPPGAIEDRNDWAAYLIAREHQVDVVLWDVRGSQRHPLRPLQRSSKVVVAFRGDE